jgi:hypothetical protein
MAGSIEALVAFVSVLLLAATSLALFLGLVGGLAGERFERCPRCKHFGLTVGGRMHGDGCPSTLHRRLVHLAHASFHDLHLRHH